VLTDTVADNEFGKKLKEVWRAQSKKHSKKKKLTTAPIETAACPPFRKIFSRLVVATVS